MNDILPSRPSTEYQGIDGQWYRTLAEAQKKNREWTALYPTGISGPSVFKQTDEWGERTMLSCGGCRHLIERRFSFYVESQPEVHAGFLREHQDAVPGYTQSSVIKYCTFLSSETEPFKRQELRLGGHMAVRPKDCPAYQLADKA